MTLRATAQPSDQSPLTLLLRRMRGMALRHVFLYTRSLPRLIEMFYWPMVNILVYGFVSLYTVRKLSGIPVETGAFLAGVLMAEILIRTTMGLFMVFMEEIWSRNLGHLFASPLRVRDYILSIIGISFVRSTVSVIPAFILTYFLFDFSILRLGWMLPVYILLLVFSGWWQGMIIISLVLRFGMAAEWLGWMATWLLLPFIAPYYPVSIMPEAFQLVSHSLPATYVFESIKSLIGHNEIHSEYLWMALGLNLFYFVVASVVFWRAYQGARNRGGLLQVGE